MISDDAACPSDLDYCPPSSSPPFPLPHSPKEYDMNNEVNYELVCYFYFLLPLLVVVVVVVV